MEVMVQVATRHNILFGAPTGKAAKVLDGRVGRFGCSARTIHSLLEPSPEGGFSFARNEDNPLPTRVLVLDEASMIDLPLFHAVLQALPEDAHLILLGDPNQLPSIGPGQVLDDVLALPGDHHRLSVTHRNKGAILNLVASIREGRFPGDIVDSSVILAGDPGLPGDGCEPVIGRYLDSIREVGIENVGFLIPRRKGKADEAGWNTTYMNARLQEIINPQGIRLPGSTLRAGDRIIVRRNLLIESETCDGEPSMEYLVNGDTGTLKAFRLNPSSHKVETLYLVHDGGREVELPGEYLEVIGLAYATTVYAAQGSEYRHVILLVNRGAPGFMNRKILYTAVSRARERLVVYGAPEVLSQVARQHAPPRFAGLSAEE